MSNIKDNIKSNFLAIDKNWTSNIPDNIEKNRRGKWVHWGSENNYPNFLYLLYENVPTLTSIINGIVDYVSGDKVKSNLPTFSDNQMREIVRKITKQISIYGGVALDIIRSKMGNPISMKVLDMRCIRSDKYNTVFFYSEDYRDDIKGYSPIRNIVFKPYDKLDLNETNSIYFVKDDDFKTYPVPIYGSAVTSCLTEMKINRYHLNSISNGFSPSYIINLNNGVPSDEIRNQIEDDINEKFSGEENAGRIMICFNDSKDNGIDIVPLDVADYGEKYEALAKRTRQEIFTSFRANPNLFGINTDNNGFATEDYVNSYKLFNKTVITPIQQKVVNLINDIFGDGSVEITPFDIKFDTINTNKTVE